MSVFYSNELTAVEPTLATPPISLQNEALAGGKVRAKVFTYTSPASNAPAVGEFVNLVKLPKGAVVLGFGLVAEALSSAGGTAGADFGLADDMIGTNFAAILAAVNLDAAATSVLVPVLDKAPSAVKTAAYYFAAKVTGEAWATSKKVQGYVLYAEAR